jgi:glycosyltransferase involved in cell wall biosynthesis
LDIVLPCYGNLPLLKVAVESVLRQDDDRWQLTVVDDGDDPEFPAWFASLNQPRVRYEQNEVNLGVSGNFQKCLDAAKHEYVVVMGADDIMLPNYVRTVLGLTERFPAASIIQPGVEVIGSEGEPAHTLADFTKQHIYRPKVTGDVVLSGERLVTSLLHGDWLYFPSLCWRTEALASAGFDKRFVIVQDLSAVLRLLEQGAKLVASDTVCFQYRRHALSVSSAGAVRGSRFVEERAFFREMARLMDARGWPRAARAARWHVSSRLHALTMVPTAACRQPRGVGTLLGHALRPMRRHRQRPESRG